MSEDIYAGLDEDDPCRTCGHPEDFTDGVERCDDQPCEKKKAYTLQLTTSGVKNEKM